MLTLHLSFQASLVFLQSANHQAFQMLMYFIVCPSGVIEDDMEMIWEGKWTENKQALTMQDILQEKPYSIATGEVNEWADR